MRSGNVVVQRHQRRQRLRLQREQRGFAALAEHAAFNPQPGQAEAAADDAVSVHGAFPPDSILCLSQKAVQDAFADSMPGNRDDDTIKIAAIHAFFVCFYCPEPLQVV